MYSLKKFKHLENNYMLVELDDKVKNNFLSSFLIGIDRSFLRLSISDLNEATDYYKNKLNDKLVEKFNGKKFNKLTKNHLEYLGEICKMNIVIFDLNKLQLKFNTDLSKYNKTIYLFKHGRKEYLLMKQNLRGMVSKLPVSIFEQFGGGQQGQQLGPKELDRTPREDYGMTESQYPLTPVREPGSPASVADSLGSQDHSQEGESSENWVYAIEGNRIGVMINDPSFETYQIVTEEEGITLIYREKGEDDETDTVEEKIVLIKNPELVGEEFNFESYVDKIKEALKIYNEVNEVNDTKGEDAWKKLLTDAHIHEKYYRIINMDREDILKNMIILKLLKDQLKSC